MSEDFKSEMRTFEKNYHANEDEDDIYDFDEDITPVNNV